MKNKVIEKTVFVDLLGYPFDKKDDATNSNHEIQLKFRQYIQEELLRTFSDGRTDKLATTNELWLSLDFTPECIRKIIEIMDR